MVSHHHFRLTSGRDLIICPLRYRIPRKPPNYRRCPMCVYSASYAHPLMNLIRSPFTPWSISRQFPMVLQNSSLHTSRLLAQGRLHQYFHFVSTCTLPSADDVYSFIKMDNKNWEASSIYGIVMSNYIPDILLSRCVSYAPPLTHVKYTLPVWCPW